MWLEIGFGAALAVFGGGLGAAMTLLYRVCVKALDHATDARRQTEVVALEIVSQLRSTQQNQTAVISELLAHKTLAETGNMHVAGQMLQHSDALNWRSQMSQPHPENNVHPSEEELPLGPHESPEILFGQDDDNEVPLPGEE